MIRQRHERYRQKPAAMILSALAKIGAISQVLNCGERGRARARAGSRHTTHLPATCVAIVVVASPRRCYLSRRYRFCYERPLR